MNVKSASATIQIAQYYKVLGSPIRIQLLFSIGYGEACVCHLERLLKKRQAYISQHLMVLRDAEILETRREGKYIFYRVADQGLLDLIQETSEILHIPKSDLPQITGSRTLSMCDCPSCQPNGK